MTRLIAYLFSINPDITEGQVKLHADFYMNDPAHWDEVGFYTMRQAMTRRGII